MLEVLSIAKGLTQCKVLALVMSQYDPLGLMVPLLLRAKILLRLLYGNGQDNMWDSSPGP